MLNGYNLRNKCEARRINYSESVNKKKAKKLINKCVIVGSEEEMASTDLEKVALAKKVGKDITVEEVKAQLDILEAMGPLNEEEYQGMVHWLLEAEIKLGGALGKLV